MSRSGALTSVEREKTRGDGTDARQADPAGARAGCGRRRDRHRAGRAGRHAGPADGQALPGGILPRRRPSRDPQLQLPAGDRRRDGDGARLRCDELGRGLRRLRDAARSRNAAGRPVARRHGAGAGRRPRPPHPRRRAPFAPRDPEAPDRATGGGRLHRADGLGARVLPVRQHLRRAARRRLSGHDAGQPVQRGLPHLPDDQGGDGDARGPHRAERRRHSGRVLQG